MSILTSGPISVGATEQGWRAILRQAFRHPADLAQTLQLPSEVAGAAAAAHASFRLFVPQPFLDLITPGDLRDPLLRQVWPDPLELQTQPGDSTDPVGDQLAQQTPGLLQKYAGRALLILGGACAIHCRYCFRRHWPYETSPAGLAKWESAFEAIQNDPGIDEIILSGGDPLMWDDGRLLELVRRLEQIPSLKRLRIHTRLPVVLPQRVTDELLAICARGHLRTVIVIHANHPRELSPLVESALRRFVDAGIPVLNQSVLLAGINDEAEILEALSRRLFDCGALPYYLHQLDRVVGARHFEVPVDVGKKLMDELRARLPGYLVPRYVREVPGEASKQWIV